MRRRTFSSFFIKDFAALSFSMVKSSASYCQPRVCTLHSRRKALGRHVFLLQLPDIIDGALPEYDFLLFSSVVPYFNFRTFRNALLRFLMSYGLGAEETGSRKTDRKTLSIYLNRKGPFRSTSFIGRQVDVSSLSLPGGGPQYPDFIIYIINNLWLFARGGPEDTADHLTKPAGEFNRRGEKKGR